MTDIPWRSIECDGEGVATVIVDDILDFRTFIHFIVKHKVGMDLGFFKVRIDGKTTCPTTLSELVKYISKYYQTKVFHESPEPGKVGLSHGLWKLPQVDQQCFSRGMKEDHVYGYSKEQLNQRNAARYTREFVKRIRSPQAFAHGSTCCMENLEISHNALEAHYWDVIYRVSELSSGLAFPGEDENDVKSRLAEEKPSIDKVIKSNSKSNLKTQDPILYASGIPVKERDFPITSNFSLSKLNTVLDICNINADGLSCPMVYVGSTHASFVYHTEDAALFSVNYLHFGAPCVWFFVSPKYFKLFSEWATRFYLDLAHVSCSSIIGAVHKYLMASRDFLLKLGIPVHMIIQWEKEIVITYPYAAHMGFKTGANVQQAANFGDEWWVELAILAPTCACFKDMVEIDLRNVIKEYRPHLLKLYEDRDLLGLYKLLAKNDHIQQLGLLPNSIQNGLPVTHNVKEKTMQDEVVSETFVKGGNKMREIKRLPLKCPDETCKQKYEGGRAKLHRMIKHIKKEHDSQSDLLDKLHLLYPPKMIHSKNSKICPLCGERRAGGNSQLNLHIRRKHSQGAAEISSDQ